MEATGETDFDVAFSFGGEDRQYADALAQLLRPYAVRCYYDQDFTVETWGEHLTEYFPNLYQKRARFVVPFLSKNYLRPWPTLEKRAALAEALNRSQAYILPVRLDDTEIPGILSTIGIIDLRKHPLEFVRDALLQKLGPPSALAFHFTEEIRDFLGVVKFFETPIPVELAVVLLGGNYEKVLESLVIARLIVIQERTISLSHPTHLAPGGASHSTLERIARRFHDFAFDHKSGPDSQRLEAQIENILKLISWAKENKSFELVLDFFPLLEKCLKWVGDKGRLLRLSDLTIEACQHLKGSSSALREAATRMEARAKICGVLWVYQRINKLDRALQEGNESLDLSKSINDPKSIAFAHKCVGRLMRMREDYEASVKHLRIAIDAFKQLHGLADIEVGDSISLLARTYFERSLKSGSERDLSEAKSLWREAHEILQYHPGTKDLADCLILWGDMLAAANIEGADQYYEKAKAQVPGNVQPKSEIVARASKQLGRYYAGRNRRQLAKSELQISTKIYDRLQELENAASSRLVLHRLEAEERGAGDLFRKFLRVAKSEPNRVIGLLAWEEHLGRERQHGVGVKRAGSFLPESYWLELMEGAHKKWAMMEHSFP